MANHRRLLGVELTVHGVEKLWQPDVWVAEMLRLPFLTRKDGPIYAWPAPPPPVSYHFLVPSGPGPNWEEEIKARNAARAEESQRVGAFIDARERERQDREL